MGIYMVDPIKYFERKQIQILNAVEHFTRTSPPEMGKQIGRFLIEEHCCTEIQMACLDNEATASPNLVYAPSEKADSTDMRLDEVRISVKSKKKIFQNLQPTQSGSYNFPLCAPPEIALLNPHSDVDITKFNFKQYADVLLLIQRGTINKKNTSSNLNVTIGAGAILAEKLPSTVLSKKPKKYDFLSNITLYKKEGQIIARIPDKFYDFLIKSTIIIDNSPKARAHIDEVYLNSMRSLFINQHNAIPCKYRTQFPDIIHNVSQKKIKYTPVCFDESELLFPNCEFL